MLDTTDRTVPDTALQTSRARRAIGRLHKVAGRVMTLDGMASVSCFVGGVALDQMAPGLSKILDPHMVHTTVQSGLRTGMVAMGAAMGKLEAQRGRPLPSLGTIAARLDAKARSRTAATATAEVLETPAVEAPSTKRPALGRR